MVAMQLNNGGRKSRLHYKTYHGQLARRPETEKRRRLGEFLYVAYEIDPLKN
jgi:hypothetical protein